MATFYQTRITIDVLHEHPTPDEWEVADIVREGDPGSYVIDESDHRTQLRSYEPKPSKPLTCQSRLPSSSTCAT